MSCMKGSVHLDGRPTLETSGRHAELVTQDGAIARFRVFRADALSRRAAERFVAELEPHVAAQPPLLTFRTASPEARALLREHEVSYVGDDGEWFLRAPSVYVERPPIRAVSPVPVQARSPFAVRASRVSRWLLLNMDARPSLKQLADAVDLSEPTVSRTAAAMADAAFVELTRDAEDSRIRRVRMRNSDATLEALERAPWLGRVRSQTWDIGARDAASALEQWRQAADELAALPYAVGGPAGAALLERVVEPADATIWIRDEDLASWRESLLAEPGRPARGSVTVQRIPDPFLFGLARRIDGLSVADPVQLYLDCRRAGERALEQADAIRQAMHW